MSAAGDARTALVTGGARGIGWATVEELVRRDWRVAIGDVDGALARERAATDPARLLALELDVRSTESARAACDAVVAKWGRLDLLVNNAGVARHAALATVSAEDWRFVLDVNLDGTLVCMQAAAHHMLAAGSGSIVNVVSVAAARGTVARAAYAASKAAVVSLTRSAAVEWAARGVRVNAVGPGYVDTPLLRELVTDGSFRLDPVLARTPMGRLGAPEEIARAIAFLGGHDSTYVTGQVLYVDGGFLADYGIPSGTEEGPS